jgi:hypothetical protein
LATALCSLPVLPPGQNVAACGSLVRYTVSFYAGSRRLTAVHVPVTCVPVTGLGPARAGNTAVVWRSLGQAIGLTRATQATFEGKL